MTASEEESKGDGTCTSEPSCNKHQQKVPMTSTSRGPLRPEVPQRPTSASCTNEGDFGGSLPGAHGRRISRKRTLSAGDYAPSKATSTPDLNQAPPPVIRKLTSKDSCAAPRSQAHWPEQILQLPQETASTSADSVDMLRKRLQEKELELETLRTSVADLQGKLELSNKEAAIREQKLAVSRTQNDEISREVADLQEKLELSNKEAAIKEQKLAVSRTQNDELTREVADLQEKLELSKKEAAIKERKLAASRTLTDEIALSVADLLKKIDLSKKKAAVKEVDPSRSKGIPGFVGLKNQGGTCYLNSVLQVLYFTNCLRSAVFRIPTESDDSMTSVPMALQRTFYKLQISAESACTANFPWNSGIERDAQDACRTLLDKIDEKLKDTDLKDTISKLFCGKMSHYIKCTQVDYESRWEESFMYIVLKVRGNRDIHAAFRDYLAVEMLTGDNKYNAGSTHGLQEAEKGVQFINFPPVLHLHLMRVEYDFEEDNTVKINDRFEFPYELNLKEYVQDRAKAQYTDYFLHAVVVHSGRYNSGHYSAYVNPLGDNEWYCFNDTSVSKCLSNDAIQMNYGNSDEADEWDFKPQSTACMLVYIAKNAKEEVLCPVTEEDIPGPLRKRFREEQLSVDEND